MQLSLAGVIICGLLWFLGSRLGAPIIAPMLASLAFGSTAIATIGALGGSSPLIYTVFVLLFLASMLPRRNLLRDLGRVFSDGWVPFIVLALMVYACLGAYILPRLFAGETTAFVVSRTGTGGAYVEVSLAPTSANTTQTGYFMLGALTFYAASVVLLKRRAVEKFRLGFFAFAFMNAALGIIDLAGKMAGLGDVLAPIRTASYSLLTESAEAGFWRIVGGFAETSAFSAATLPCIAFTFCYGRVAGSRISLALSAVLLALLVFSTSSTGYVAGAIIAIPLILSTAHATLSGRLTRFDVALMALVVVVAVIALWIFIFDARAFDPLVRLFDATLFNKASSSSAQERGYWNSRSLQALVDTAGLGIGFGSSRASSWVVALLSQMGVLGALMMAMLIGVLAKGIGRPMATADLELLAIHQGVRASALASLTALSISNGSADPGLLVFIALAVVLACRRFERQRRPAAKAARMPSWASIREAVRLGAARNTSSGSA